MKKVHLSLLPYETRRSTLIVCNEKEIKNFFKKNNLNQTANENTDGMTFLPENSTPIIWINARLKKQSRYGTVVHELVHLMSWIHEEKGILYDPKNDEPYAYLISNLFDQIIDAKIL